MIVGYPERFKETKTGNRDAGVLTPPYAFIRHVEHCLKYIAVNNIPDRLCNLH